MSIWKRYPRPSKGGHLSSSSTEPGAKFLVVVGFPWFNALIYIWQLATVSDREFFLVTLRDFTLKRESSKGMPLISIKSKFMLRNFEILTILYTEKLRNRIHQRPNVLNCFLFYLFSKSSKHQRFVASQNPSILISGLFHSLTWYSNDSLT